MRHNSEKRETQQITVYVLLVYGLQGQLKMKEKKDEELYNACTRTVLMMGNMPTFMVDIYFMVGEERERDTTLASDSTNVHRLKTEEVFVKQATLK